MSLKIEQVHKYFVGEVSGIDLSDPLSKSEVTEIEEGMDQFGVLIFSCLLYTSDAADE